MCNFAYFSFKFWIWCIWNIYKILQIFILLSGLWAFMSERLYQTLSLRGERSLNDTSTASRLIFAHPLYHHHRLCHCHSPPSTRIHPGMSLSPLLRDVGSTTDNPASVEPTQPNPPPSGMCCMPPYPDNEVNTHLRSIHQHNVHA